MLDSIMAEIAYKCNLCGQLFSSPDDAQNHNQKVHTKPESKDEFGSWVMGTSSPPDASHAVAEKEKLAGSVTQTASSRLSRRLVLK